MMEVEHFLIRKHHKFIQKCLALLPSAYTGFQCSKPTVLFFLLGGLDILDKLDKELANQDRCKIIDWIYAHQLDTKSGQPVERCGFRGSIITDYNKTETENSVELCIYDTAHLAQTYTALCCLLMLADDFSRVDKSAILTMVGACQKSDGSFYAHGSQNSENDMRFVFCAVAVCFILNDFSRIDIERLVDFIGKSVSYDGGIAQAPHCESHEYVRVFFEGGSTYCAIASLWMLGRLWDHSVLSRQQIERLKAWAVFKQEVGFHGRTNKSDDSCYAFWIGATLAMLNNAQCLVDESEIRRFLMFAQNVSIGGFSKYEDSTPDILHTYFSLAALSIFGEPSLQPVFAPLNITQRAYDRLRRLHTIINKNDAVH